MNLCVQEKFHLPFGKDSVLHMSEIDRLKNILDSAYGMTEEYRDI